jgi:vacuolar protein sorting-associated protein 13A/C
MKMTLDEVSKNAQQQLNQALKDKPKFSLDLDIAAPKITIPTDFFPDGKNQCKLLVDLGYLTLQTEEEGAADATQEELDLYMRFRIWLSDVSAFLVDGDFSWHKNYNMDATAGKLRLTDKESWEEGTWNGSGGLKSLAGEISVNGVNGGDVKIENGAGAIKIYEKSESGKCNSDVGFNFWPVLEKTGMAVALQQICVPHSLYASTRVAVRVPSLGFQFSPARFHRLMQVLKVFQSSPDDAEDSSIRPWDPADFEGQMSVLSWKVREKQSLDIRILAHISQRAEYELYAHPIICGHMVRQPHGFHHSLLLEVVLY